MEWNKQRYISKFIVWMTLHWKIEMLAILAFAAYLVITHRDYNTTIATIATP